MTAPAIPAHELVATTLARVDLDTNEQWTVMWALMDRYAAASKQRDRCRNATQGAPTGVIAPEIFAEWADNAERDIAVIDAVVAKLPGSLRKCWADEVAKAVAR